VRDHVDAANLLVRKGRSPDHYIHLPMLPQHGPGGLRRAGGPASGSGHEVFLGLIHRTDGSAGARRRIELASAAVHDFGVEIASMVDEHTRESLLNIVRLVAELDTVFAARGGPPRVPRLDNGPEMTSQALQQFCGEKIGLSYIPPGTPRNNGFVESFNGRMRRECLNRNHWTSLLEARVVIGDFKDEHNRRHRHSALGYLTQTEYAARCSHTDHPVACEI
jgi:transposase InsO family protein